MGVFMLLVFFLCTSFSIFSSDDTTQQKIKFFTNISKIKDHGFHSLQQDGWSAIAWNNLLENCFKYRYAANEKKLVLHFEIISEHQEIWNRVEQLLQNADLLYFIFTMRTEQNNNDELISNLLQKIPEFHRNKIEGFDFSESKISIVPDFLARFINLKFFSIQRNNIVTLPEWLKNMQKIEMFFASENQIISMKNIPFENITYLDMYKNEINMIEFQIMPILRHCDLRQNPMNEEKNEIKYEDIPGIEKLLIPSFIKYQGFDNFDRIHQNQTIILEKNDQADNN